MRKLWVVLFLFLTACGPTAVSDVVYVFDKDNPDHMTDVSFFLEGTAASVNVSLDDGETWHSCNEVIGTLWTCPLEGVTVTDDMSMRVEVKQ